MIGPKKGLALCGEIYKLGAGPERVKKFAHKMYFYGKKCYILINKTHFHAGGEFVTKNCNDKARSSFKELKALLQWKDIDETWINDKEVDPFDHIIKFANKSSTTTSDTIRLLMMRVMMFPIHNVHMY